MKIHKRTMPVQKASAEISIAFWRMVDEFDLTLIEAAQVANDLVAGCLKHALRAERHPGNPEHKADEE